MPGFAGRRVWARGVVKGLLDGTMRQGEGRFVWTKDPGPPFFLLVPSRFFLNWYHIHF